MDQNKVLKDQNEKEIITVTSLRKGTALQGQRMSNQPNLRSNRLQGKKRTSARDYSKPGA